MLIVRLLPYSKTENFQNSCLSQMICNVFKVPGPSTIGFLNDAYLTPRSDFTRVHIAFCDEFYDYGIPLTFQQNMLLYIKCLNTISINPFSKSICTVYYEES